MGVTGAENENRPAIQAPTTNQIVAISFLTGAFGVVSGYCIFLLWEDEIRKDEGWPFLIGLAIAALASFAIEYLRDIIQHGEADRIKPRRVLVTILTLMMFELFIVAWEDVAPRWKDAQVAAGSSRLTATLLGPLTGVMKEGHPMLDITVLGFLWVVGGIVLATTLGFAAASPKKMSLRSQIARGVGRGLVAAMFTAPVGTVLYVLLVRVVLSVRMMVFDHAGWSANLLALSRAPDTNVLLRSCYTLFRHVYEFCGQSWWGPLLSIAIFIAAIYILAAFRAAPVIILLVVAAAAALFGQAWHEPGILIRLYVLGALIWIGPALFLGLTMPLMRRPAEMPREWGLVAFLAALCLLVLTWGRFHYWGVVPCLALVIAGVLIYRGMSVMDYWPIVALSTSILVYGTSLMFQNKTFVSSVHYLNSQPAVTVDPDSGDDTTVLDHADRLVNHNKVDLNVAYLNGAPITSTPTQRPMTFGSGELQHITHFKPTPTPNLMAWFLAPELIYPVRPAQHPAAETTAAPPSAEATAEITLREDTERRLELALSASVGFWTTVGLLAIWALRRRASEPAGLGTGH